MCLNGDGTFQPATKLTTGKNPTRVATGDFNSDGKSDLIVVRAGDASVSDNGDATIFLGNGDGTFSPGQVLAPGKNPFAVAVSDLNADHKLDLIFASSTANSTNNSVTILLGNGDGTFQTANAIPDASITSAEVAADVNGDSNLDLIGTSSDHTQLVVLLGNGDGTFQQALTLAAGANPAIGSCCRFGRRQGARYDRHQCELELRKCVVEHRH